MANQLEPSSASQPSRARQRRAGWTIRITPSGVAIFSLLNLIILGGLVFGISLLIHPPELPAESSLTSPPLATQSVTSAHTAPTLTNTIRSTASPTTYTQNTSTPPPPTASPQPVGTLTLNTGLIILALDEGGNTHLFAYQPADAGAEPPLPLTRLTYGPWDDMDPAISSDGNRVAFASNRNGYWDIYILDLNSGEVTRLTDTLEYEGAPTWSPDSQWLAYEAYVNENLEIKVRALNNAQDTLLLTTDPAADSSPAWSPDGRRIAFVSNRSGEDEIWIADLDNGETQRFTDISHSPTSKDTHPTWSPDGSALIWASESEGMRNLIVQELPSNDEQSSLQNDLGRRNLGSGDWPAWSADGETILTILHAPNLTYLTAYQAHYDGLVLPAIQVPGYVRGFSWGKVSLTSPLQAVYQLAAQLTPTALYTSTLATSPEDNGGRYQLSQLIGVQAPHSFLHDLVDESFQALRRRIATEAGWDFLASLENAYVPLTSPLEPGMGHDWLYTGRAMAINPLPTNAGWLVVVREDFGSETYWRIYLRALYQDGSAGMPLHDQPWDFNARNNGDTNAYELGGAAQKNIPSGYWIDFTLRAYAYGWERLPALPTWRASYPATRFNEFVIMGGMDWQTAMLELYPPEAMITPTAVVPPTRTYTPTSRWYVSPTPTLTPSPRPTLTPDLTTPTNPPPSMQHLLVDNSTPGG